ncbi:MAG: hypothetical protein WAR37_00500 [Candidatus Microsaccharimonas sp.]
MSLYLKQTDTRSELQDRIATELQEKAKKKALEAERPDGITDSAYLKNTKSTTSLAWVWLVIGVALIGSIIWLIVTAASL